LENIYKNNIKNIKNEVEKILENPIETGINTLNEKINIIKKIETTEYVEILDLNGDERIILLLFYSLLASDLNYEINKKIKDKITKEWDKDILSKLYNCLFYNPYSVYENDILLTKIYFTDNYNKYFNYESLLKLNVTMYSTLIIFNDEKFFLNTKEFYVTKLRTMIDALRVSKCYKIDKDLYNKFLELKEQFLETEENYYYYY